MRNIFRVRRSFRSVVENLAAGLENGVVSLDYGPEAQHDAPFKITPPEKIAFVRSAAGLQELLTPEEEDVLLTGVLDGYEGRPCTVPKGLSHKLIIIYRNWYLEGFLVGKSMREGNSAA